MIDQDFVDQYATSLNNLVNPRRAELEEQFKAAYYAIDEIKGLHKSHKDLESELDRLAQKYQAKRLLIADDDPIRRAADVLNKCTDRYEAKKKSGTMSISDVCICFDSAAIRHARKYIKEGRNRLNKIDNLYENVFCRVDDRLEEIRSTLIRLQVDLNATTWGVCHSKLTEIRSRLNGSITELSLTEVIDNQSLAVQDLEARLAVLELESQDEERKAAERAKDLAEAEAIRLRQEEERRREQDARIAKEAADREAKMREEQAIRLRQEEERRRKEIAIRDEEIRRTQEKAHFESMSGGRFIVLNIAMLLLGVILLYFVMSNFEAFDSSFITAIVYVLFSLGENQWKLREIKAENTLPSFWPAYSVKLNTRRDLAKQMGFQAKCRIFPIMVIQLVGGFVYALFNRGSPVELTWLGFIFPHTWSHGFWYLLIAPLTTVCAAAVPASLYNLQVVSYYGKMLKNCR